jgi:integrase
VAAFYDWLLDQGFAFTTAAHRLATVKRYAFLSAQAGILDHAESQMIRGVAPYLMKEARSVDTKRERMRIGNKKTEPTKLPVQAISQLRHAMQARDTERDRRDLVLLSLLVEHGLRVGEIVAFSWANINITARETVFYRPKTGSTTRQRMTRGLYESLVAYREVYPHALDNGVLIVASQAYKPILTPRALTYAGLQERAMRFGQLMGIDHVSSHDFRHHAATEMVRQGRSIQELRGWFGWSRESTMPLRYIAVAKVVRRGDLAEA